jgi:VWFA-related protein
MRARARLYLLAAVCCLGLSLTGADGTGFAQSGDKTIYLSVIDSDGKPIGGLTVSDFAVREDGSDREIVSVVPATQPLRVALLIDTTAGAERFVQNIRKGMTAFVHDVLTASPEAQISLWEFGQASVRLANFTSDTAALDKEIGRLFPRPHAGAVLLEGLVDASKALGDRPSPRRAIVVFNLEPNNEQSEEQPNKVNEALKRAGTQVWALSLQNGSLDNRQREFLLNAFVRNAGGMREYIAAESAIEGYMRRYAAALTSQYELTYNRAPGRAQVVQVGIRRDGVKVVAGLFAPQ